MASIAYGSLMAAVLAVLAVLSFVDGSTFGVIWALFILARVAFAVGMAVGGVLILKRRQHGPACAGLASIFLFSCPVVGFFWQSAFAGGGRALVLELAAFFSVYSVPIAVVVWSLREEIKRQELEAEAED